MKLVVIGGTGLVGSQVVQKLTAAGHEAVPAAPDTGVDLITGNGLDQVLEGAEVVINVANSPTFDEASLDFFRTSMTNLLADALVKVATGPPLNGMWNVAGPDVFRLDELGKVTLAAHHDGRTVITDNKAGLFAAVTGDVLTAGPEAHLAPTHYQDWMQKTH